MGWLIVFRPPPPFGGQPPQSRENEKTPSMVGKAAANIIPIDRAGKTSPIKILLFFFLDNADT
jgi:hypothetical protein